MDDYLRRHDGVITRAQANSCGLSDAAIGRRVRSGRWRRVGPGVYFVDDRPFTSSAHIRATVWSYGARAVASGLAAAFWHGLLPASPETIEVTLPRNSHGRRRGRAQVRRRDLASADVVERNGLRVTALPLTALEAAARRGGGAAVIDCAVQRHTDLPQLWQAHLRNTGRYGAVQARLMLQAAKDGGRSHAERMFLQLLRDAGIGGWIANHPVGSYLVDVAFPAAKVAVEIDGYAFHSSHADFANDRVRQNRIALLGWQVLRFTWRDLTENPERVIRDVLRAISAR